MKIARFALISALLWGADSKSWGAVEAASPSKAETAKSRIHVLARVAGSVITDRQVLREVFIENPELYVPGDRRKKVTKANFDQAFGRLTTQIMVSEENRIVGLARVSDSELSEALADFKKAMGPNYKRFLSDFELAESELMFLLGDKLLLRKVLAAKVRDSDKKQERAEVTIEDWLKQLRARYRVQMFREDSSGTHP